MYTVENKRVEVLEIRKKKVEWLMILTIAVL